MNSVTVDELVMRIEVELDKFRAQAGQAEAIDAKLRKSLKNTEKTAKQTGEGFDELGGSIEGSNKQLKSKLKTLATATRRLVGFFAVITGSNAIQRLATNIADANDQLRFLSQRLGMSAGDVRKLDNAVAALGGTNAQAINTIKSLNQGIQEMVIMGNDSLIPFFGALGVGAVDAAGNVRAMDDILLDMADSLSRMDPQRAYAIASAMGIDDGVANALIQGREAMQEMLDMQDTLYVSTQAELEASRELRRAQTFLGRQWESLKTVLGNAIVPLLSRMTKIVSEWMDFLLRNERTVRNVFEGIAVALGVVLIPLLIKAAAAMIAFVSPILLASASVLALAAAFVLLYDDYKTWAQGGKSFFDWGAFEQYIFDTNISVKSLTEGFATLLTGYKSWGEAWDAAFNWLQARGFIDETGTSVGNLAEAFKNLGKSIIENIPFLGDFNEIMSLFTQGEYRAAGAKIMELSDRLLKSAHEGRTQTGEHIKRSIGVALGHPAPAGDDLEVKLAVADAANGLPAGTMKAIMMQETGGNQAYIDDPAKYHYELNAEGKRIAGHTGKVSTAFGPFGILESTGRDPGFGVTPLQDKSIDEQIRFASEYLAARVRSAGSFEGGLAGYGEGAWYANSVVNRIESGATEARSLSSGFIGEGGPSGSASRSMEVNIGSVNVQTSATTLPAATSDGVAAGIKQSGDLLNQLAGGM